MRKGRKSLLGELWERRVFQIIGLYLGGGWAVLEFVSGFLVDRFGFNKELIILSFTAILSILPSITMIAWFHGRPGPDQWHRFEKFGIPINIIITTALLFYIGSGNDLGADTVIDPAASTTPDSSSVSPNEKVRLSLWNFEADPDDQDLYWLADGLPFLLYNALGQDIFLSLNEQNRFRREILERDPEDPMVLPLSLIRDISLANNYALFLTGKLERNAGDLSATVRIYDSESFKLLTDKYLELSDIPAALDSLTAFIRNTVSLRSNSADAIAMIPSGEYLSRNPEVLREYCAGRRQLVRQNNYSEALTHFRRAHDMDPDFHFAALELLKLHISTNNQEDANRLLDNFLQNLYSLPEQDRYYVRYYSYLYRNELDKAVTVLDMWKERYPEDTRPYYRMAYNHYRNQGRYREAIKEYCRILELDPGADGLLLDIAFLYRGLGETDRAREKYTQYIEKHPDQLRGFIELAAMEKDRGNFKEATDLYNRILILDDNNPTALTALGEIKINHADFAQSEALLARAIHHSHSPADSIAVLRMLSYQHLIQADYINTLRYRILADNISKRTEPPINMLLGKLNDIEIFLEMGEEKVALDIISEIKKVAAPLNSIYLAGELEFNITLRKRNEIGLTLASIESSHLKDLLGIKADVMKLQGEAAILEIDGNYEKAAETYASAMAMNPESELFLNIPRCRNLRLAGKYEDAVRCLEKTMAIIPAFPEMHYEMAQCRWAMGDKPAALDHLTIALKIWENAHPNYRLAKEARGLMRQWKILM